MSTVYSTEPATTGRVVIDTTHGPIDINLWCKECPTTTRTFLQLCIDGYYDHLVFHRILSDFLIQTGLTRDASMMSVSSSSKIDSYLRQSTAVPIKSTNSMSGDILGLDRKKLELNPRIRFNHRGQVAMAFPLEEESSLHSNDDENGMLRYQFFVTLDEAPFLDSKHVVFGTVVGSTMFNALRLGRTDADESGIPTDMTDSPPRIKSIKIDYHPFEDLVVTADKKIPWKKGVEGKDGKNDNNKSSAMEKRRKKIRGKRDLNVLSFGDEERDFDDTTISNSSGNKKKQKKGRVLLPKDKSLPSKVDADSDDERSKMESASAVMPEKLKTVAYQTKTEKKEESKSVRIKEDQKQQGSGKPTKSKGMSAVEARRAKYLKSGNGTKSKGQREGDTLTKLSQFKSKVLDTKGSVHYSRKHATASADDSLAARMAKRLKQTKDEEEKRKKEDEAFAAIPGYSGLVNKDEYNNDQSQGGGGWMAVKFKCKRHIDNDSRKTALDKGEMGGDNRHMDDYVVLDQKRSGRRDGKNHK